MEINFNELDSQDSSVPKKFTLKKKKKDEKPPTPEVESPNTLKKIEFMKEQFMCS